MRNILNTGKQILVLLMVTAGCFLNSSCEEEELNIQDNFPFGVSVMPVPDEIADEQTVELRFTIQPTGNYSNTRYFIRYFQFEGQGTLQYFDDPPYLPNDLYELPDLQFRLYYTSASVLSQSFDVWISDNFGNERQVSFQFNSSD
ncbi:DUF3872 domain-containing protein [Flavobacterium coralii]|uniref:DUF3872 domain-containing protein n=1 Tax=Flavobacterium coralii TaxID=2838017 RepID=UPI000C3D4A13|nr:conjugal transfer protein TraQ [Flavobacterium sp.]|tara:strand:- start:52360 stop:52794 length:435 start_codon:yes stop_codon:yes gene_type:complete